MTITLGYVTSGTCPQCGATVAITSHQPQATTPTLDCPSCDWKGPWTPTRRYTTEGTDAL